jgi:hypothetical protein
VSGWSAAHGSIFATLQADLAAVAGAGPASAYTNYSSYVPLWQQIERDANYALGLPPIPAATIEPTWTAALNQLIEGAADCIASVSPSNLTQYTSGQALLQAGSVELAQVASSVKALAA